MNTLKKFLMGLLEGIQEYKRYRAERYLKNYKPWTNGSRSLMKNERDLTIQKSFYPKRVEI